MSKRSSSQTLVYAIFRQVARIAYVLCFRLRCKGRHNYPAQGGALVCANHQSHLDPVLVGLTCDRRLNYLARSSLFRFPVFRQLIRFLDAIAIDREGMGLSGFKESLRRLKRGEMLLIFPEGTRTHSGEVARLKPGFCSLARRAKVPIVPVGFDGAFEAWPRSAPLPRPAAIYLCVGPPIDAASIERMSDDQLVNEVAERIQQCHAAARRGRQGGGF